MTNKIGERIKNLRKNANITQEKFAEYLGITFQAVSRWEREEAYPDIEILPAVAKYFNVTTDELLGVDENKISMFTISENNFQTKDNFKLPLRIDLTVKSGNDICMSYNKGKLILTYRGDGVYHIKFDDFVTDLQSECITEKLELDDFSEIILYSDFNHTKIYINGEMLLIHWHSETYTDEVLSPVNVIASDVKSFKIKEIFNTMAGKERFEIVKFGPCRFIGKSVYSRAIFDSVGDLVEGEFPTGKIFGNVWMQNDWIFKKLDNMKKYATEIDCNSALITWEKYDDKNKLQGYTVGRFMKADTPVPKLMDYIDIPEMYVAKVYMRGDVELVKERTTGDFFATIGDAENIVFKEIENQNMYKKSSDFMAEVYTEKPDEKGNISRWEFWCACELITPAQV